MSFGGAGGLHVCDLAAALRVPRVIVPSSPGTLSALGVLLGDVVKDYSRTVMIKTTSFDVRVLERGFAELEREAARDLKREGFGKDRTKLARSVAMRYTGQSFEIDIPWSKSFEARFHEAHRERYGYADSSRSIEVVSLRLRAAGVTQKPRFKRQLSGKANRVEPINIQRVYLNERPSRVPVYSRLELKAGTMLEGPAIITEYSSTTLVPKRFTVKVDPWLNLVIEVA